MTITGMALQSIVSDGLRRVVEAMDRRTRAEQAKADALDKIANAMVEAQKL